MADYRIEGEVSVMGWPWVATWVEVQASHGSVPSARAAAYELKEQEALHRGLGVQQLRVRRVRVLAPGGSGLRRA